MQFRSFDFVGNRLDGFLYQSSDNKMWHINHTSNTYRIYENAYINPSAPCTYEFYNFALETLNISRLV